MIFVILSLPTSQRYFEDQMILLYKRVYINIVHRHSYKYYFYAKNLDLRKIETSLFMSKDGFLCIEKMFGSYAPYKALPDLIEIS